MTIDWKKLREISERAEALAAVEQMTPEAFRKLRDEALVASDGETEVLEGLALFAPSELLTVE